MRTLSISLFALFALSGCATDWCNEPANHYDPAASYGETYRAVHAVLCRHFQVHTSRHTPNDADMFAVSKITHDGINQFRFKVTARVVEDEDDLFSPEIRVLEQVDMSMSNAGVRSVAQSDHDWRTTGFNHSMEAQLLNEVQELLRNRKGFESKMFLNPLPAPGAAAPPADPSAY